MLKIEHTEVLGWEHAIRGMRNPLNSWDKSDTWDCADRKCVECPLFSEKGCGEHFNPIIGHNDLDLMKRLVKAGTDHSKFMRMITVSCDVTSNHTWWAEFDTYKVGTVRNSCSKMHKIHVKEFAEEDFSHEGIDSCGRKTKKCFSMVLEELERLRRLFNEKKDQRYWRAIIELLPMGYNIKATVQLNYAVLRNVYHARKNHKLDEWHQFCEWIESLPYSELITMEKGE